MENTTLTSIPGLLVGHATDRINHTGCTAVLCPQGCTPGVAVPGFAPGSREIELLRPESTVETVHGILLSGGSGFGLAAADGVVRFLREQGHGFVMPHGLIPLVSAAVLYDLDMNQRPGLLPDADMGYGAAKNASRTPVAQGSVGAGTGARCGRLFAMGGGPDCSEKSGLGSFALERRGVRVAALVVVNSLGNVYDPESGVFLAGGRDRHGKPFGHESMLSALADPNVPLHNTVLTVVATNVALSKVQTSRLARMASAGLARAIFPAHLSYDGDVVFALAAQGPFAGEDLPWSENLLGCMAAQAVARAAAKGVLLSGPTGGEGERSGKAR